MKPTRPTGVRELKIHASRILRRIRETKQGVPISHRGQVIAHLIPAAEYERLTSGRADYWEALRAFREANAASLDLGDVFTATRDRTKGRRFSW